MTAADALVWTLTYLVHGTLLVGGAWLATRARLVRGLAAREWLWRVALFGGLVTATVQTSGGVRPWSGRVRLPQAVTTIVAAPAGAAATTSAGAASDPGTELVSSLGGTPGPSSAFVLRHEDDAPARPGAFDSADVRPAAASVASGRSVRSGDTSASSVASASAATAALPEESADGSSEERASSSTHAPELRGVARRPRGSDRSDEGRPGERDGGAGDPAEPVAEVVEGSREGRSAGSTPGGSRPSDALGSSRFAVLGTRLGARLDAAGPSLGLLVVGLWLVALALRARRALGRRRPVTDGPWAAELARLVRECGVRRRVRLSASARVATPVALGVLRPEVCVPERALVELPPELARPALAHELGHLVRLDPLWLGLAHAIRTLFAWQPLNRLAARELAHLAELSADAWAVRRTGDGLALARCLADVATWLRPRRSEPPLATCAMVRRRGRLEERVRCLLDGAAEREAPSSTRAPLAVALGGLAAATLALPGWTLGRSASRPAPLASSTNGELEAFPPALDVDGPARTDRMRRADVAGAPVSTDAAGAAAPTDAAGAAAPIQVAGAPAPTDAADRAVSTDADGGAAPTHVTGGAAPIDAAERIEGLAGALDALGERLDALPAELSPATAARGADLRARLAALRQDVLRLRVALAARTASTDSSGGHR